MYMRHDEGETGAARTDLIAPSRHILASSLRCPSFRRCLPPFSFVGGFERRHVLRDTGAGRVRQINRFHDLESIVYSCCSKLISGMRQESLHRVASASKTGVIGLWGGQRAVPGRAARRHVLPLREHRRDESSPPRTSPSLRSVSFITQLTVRAPRPETMSIVHRTLCHDRSFQDAATGLA